MPLRYALLIFGFEQTGAAYNQWWSSLGPLLVNEGFPIVPPEAQPFNLRFEKQQKKSGISVWVRTLFNKGGALSNYLKEKGRGGGRG